MPTTGAVFPGTGENNAGIGATAWTTPGNVTANDAALATCNAAASSQYLVARNFSFVIPLQATILGITVVVNASEHSTGSENLRFTIQDDIGTLIGNQKIQSVNGTGLTTYTQGGVGDPWGLSPSLLNPHVVNNATFGVRFHFTTAHDIRINYVTMALEYALPPPWLTLPLRPPSGRRT